MSRKNRTNGREILKVMDNFMSISKQLKEGIEIEVEEDKLATFSELC